MSDNHCLADGSVLGILVLVQSHHQVADFSDQHAEESSEPPVGVERGTVEAVAAAEQVVRFVVDARVAAHSCENVAYVS